MRVIRNYLTKGDVTITKSTFGKYKDLHVVDHPVNGLMAYVYKKPLSKLKEELHLKYGQLAFDETSIAFDEDKKNTLKHFLSDANETLFKEHLAWPIETIVKVDGTKVIFKEGDWALVRLSGTEPVARIYAESETPQRTKLILEQMQLMLSDV